MFSAVRVRIAAALRRLANRIHEQPAVNVRLELDSQHFRQMIADAQNRLLEQMSDAMKATSDCSPPWRRLSDYPRLGA